ncbi:MAG: ATP synthase F1 subunit epsilon [Patescibacteria group bacterium]
MHNLHLKIITPKRIVLEKDIISITAPSSEGDVTVLPRHTHLFSLLNEGIVTYRTEKNEEVLAIGGGYLETDGKNVQLLVTRAYGQDEIDHKATLKAIEDAKVDMKQVKDKKQLQDISTLHRRSLVDLKLLKRKAPKTFHNE